MEETTSFLSSDMQIIQGANTTQASYDWLGVLKFLQEQYKESLFKHTEHLLEKQQQQEKIHVLESDLKAQEAINRELIQRVKMLEFSLRQERVRYTKLLQSNNISPEMIQQLQQNESIATSNGAPNLPQTSQRKAKQHRPALLKLLEEVGLSDIFDDETEHLEKENPSYNNNNDRTVIVSNDISTSRISQQTQYQQQQISQQQNNSLKEGNTRNPESNNITNNNKPITSISSATPQQSQAQPLTLQTELRNHLDGVRDAFFAKESTLVTVSEDYTVKMWDTKEFTQESSQTNISPFLTLREHSQQITTITGIRAELAEVDNTRQLFLTAGFEGIVKVWGVYGKDEVDTFGPREGKYGSLGEWLASYEPIWELSAHPYENEILSASADGKVSLWQLQSSQENPSEDDQSEDLNMDRYSGHLAQTYTNQDGTDRPSSCTFLPSTLHLIAAAFTVSNSIVIFDKETGRVVNSLRDSSTLSGQRSDQIYKCVPHPQLRLILSAHEDSKIRIFDINSSKPIQQLEGHSDAVTSMVFHSNRNYLTSVGHDGAVKTWDIRQYKCLGAQQGHNSKFDEAIHNVAYNAATNSLATCGADGIVNVYSSNV